MYESDKEALVIIPPTLKTQGFARIQLNNKKNIRIFRCDRPEVQDEKQCTNGVNDRKTTYVVKKYTDNFENVYCRFVLIKEKYGKAFHTGNIKRHGFKK